MRRGTCESPVQCSEGRDSLPALPVGPVSGLTASREVLEGALRVSRTLVEAYFFADPAALERAGAIHPSSFDPLARDVEDFEVSDPPFLAPPHGTDKDDWARGGAERTSRWNEHRWARASASRALLANDGGSSRTCRTRTRRKSTCRAGSGSNSWSSTPTTSASSSSSTRSTSFRANFNPVSTRRGGAGSVRGFDVKGSSLMGLRN